jgi:hypothetical protein
MPSRVNYSHVEGTWLHLQEGGVNDDVDGVDDDDEISSGGSIKGDDDED